MENLDFLWPAIRRADADAFARFLASTELPLRRSLAPFARHVDVEVVIQETLLRIWQVASRYEPDGAPNGLFRLALRIARNLALDERKRVRRAEAAWQRSALELEVDVAPSEVDPKLRDIVSRCFEDLPPKPALALRTRLDDGGLDSDASLAERCQMSHNTFLQNMSRARRLLGECLQKRAGWELPR